jgi:P27 family predicted phage terminase small subunit
VGQTAAKATANRLAGIPSISHPTTAQPRTDGVTKAGRPRFPKHLSAVARTEMKRVSFLLEQRGTLTAGDSGVLALYGVVFARWIQAKKSLDEDGLMVTVTMKDSNGNMHDVERVNPCYKIAAECERQLLQLTKSLGLTPDAREKVKKAAPAAEVMIFKPGSVGERLHAEGKL